MWALVKTHDPHDTLYDFRKVVVPWETSYLKKLDKAKESIMKEQCEVCSKSWI